MKTYTNLYRKLKLRADNTTLLSDAITSGDVVTAIKLLDAGDVDINGGFLYKVESHVNEYDEHPCDNEYFSSVHTVQWRLNHLYHRTFIWPLEAAMRAKNLRMVSALLEYGANITDAILRLAGEWGSIHAIALLLSYGADPTQKLWFGYCEPSDCVQTMLSCAAEKGHTLAVAFLMDCGVSFSQAALTTALRWAVVSNRTPTVAALLDRGVPLDLPYPLEFGYRWERLDAQMTAVLIDRHPTAAETHGRDLLFAANRRGDVAAAALLLQCGVDLHTVQCSGFKRWHPNLVHLYLTSGADAPATANGCNKPLTRRFYEHGNTSIALLIASGAPIVDIKM